MKLISETLSVSRSHLRESLRSPASEPKKRRGREPLLCDAELLGRIENVVKERKAYGYRRACAVLNRSLVREGLPRANHKRIYRVMKEGGLLLPKFVGYQPKRRHEGTVQTLRSNTRWCSDSFQIRCWDGRKIEAAFVMDTCDREVIGFVASIGPLEAADIKPAFSRLRKSDRIGKIWNRSIT